MKNIRIVATDNNTLTVKADTKRYGNDAIMFEGRTFMECCDYIRRATGQNHFKLETFFCVPNFTDANGQTLPRILNVVI